MLKNISKLNGVHKLNNKEQKEIKGGQNNYGCPIYTARECRKCGGIPFNDEDGCCLGSPEVQACLAN